MRPIILAALLAAALTACGAPAAAPPPTAAPDASATAEPTPLGQAPPTVTPGGPTPTQPPTQPPTSVAPSPTTVRSAAPSTTLGYGHPGGAAFLGDSGTLVVGTSAGLLSLSTPDLATLRFIPLDAPVRELAARPDGRFLAASSYDGATATTRLLTPDGAVLFSAPGRAAFFGADSRLLGLADLDNSTGRYTTRLYGLPDGAELAAVPGDRAVLSPDAALIASFDREELVVGAVGGGELLRAQATSAAFSPDGATLAAAGFNGVELLPFGDGQPLQDGRRTLTGELTLDVAFAADGALLALAERGLLRWEPQAAGEPDVTPLELGAAIGRFGPRASILALDELIGDAPNELRLLRADTGAEIYADGELEGGRASFRADGAQAAVITAAGALRLVDGAQGLLAERVLAGYDLVAFAPDGGVVAGRPGPQLDRWRLDGGEEPAERVGAYGFWERPRQLSFADGRLVAELEQTAFGGFVARISALELGATEPTAVVEGVELPLPAVWDFAGGRFAWLGPEQTVLLSDSGAPRTLPLLVGVSAEAGATSLALSPDGARLAVGYDDGTLLLVEAATLTPLASGPFGAGEALTALAWSGDGRFLAMALAGGDLLAWEAIDDDNPVRFAAAPGAGATPALAWDADGGRLAVGAADGLAVYDRSSGAELLRLPLPAASVALSADGAHLAAVVRGQIVVVDVPS